MSQSVQFIYTNSYLVKQAEEPGVHVIFHLMNPTIITIFILSNCSTCALYSTKLFVCSVILCKLLSYLVHHSYSSSFNADSDYISSYMDYITYQCFHTKGTQATTKQRKGERATYIIKYCQTTGTSIELPHKCVIQQEECHT